MVSLSSSQILRMAGKTFWPMLVLTIGLSHCIHSPDLRCTNRILSSTAVTLYISYSLHNVISWIKIKPFLPRWGSLFFIITLGLVQPYWVLETWANFEYFNSLGTEAFKTTRFLEPLMRLAPLLLNRVTYQITNQSLQRPLVGIHDHQAGCGHKAELRIHLYRADQGQSPVRCHVALHAPFYRLSRHRCCDHGPRVQTKRD